MIKIWLLHLPHLSFYLFILRSMFCSKLKRLPWFSIEVWPFECLTISQSYLIFFFLGYTPTHFQVTTKFSTAIIVNNNGFDAKYQNDDDVNLVPAEQKPKRYFEDKLHHIFSINTVWLWGLISKNSSNKKKKKLTPNCKMQSDYGEPLKWESAAIGEWEYFFC